MKFKEIFKGTRYYVITSMKLEGKELFYISDGWSKRKAIKFLNEVWAGGDFGTIMTPREAGLMFEMAARKKKGKIDKKLINEVKGL